MTDTPDMSALAEKLAAIRNVIIDREGEDVQDMFEIKPYLICVNIEGSAYMDADDETTQELMTLIQVEKGPVGMESLIATAVEQYESANPEVADSFILVGDLKDPEYVLDQVFDRVYRHWHWLDLPNTLNNDMDEDPEEDQ